MLGYPIGRTETTFTIPNSVVSINDFAFSNFQSLESIEIPNSVIEIGHNPFRECKNLHTISVAKDNSEYTSIDGVLFDKDVTNLISYPIGKNESTYTIPHSITNIGERSFTQSSSLSRVIFLADKPTIGEDAFFSEYIEPVGRYGGGIGWSDDPSIDGLNMIHGIPISIDGFNLIYGFVDDGIILLDCSNSAGELIIPDSIYGVPVVEIGEMAFYDCKLITSIKIPNSVTTINESSFNYCESLRTIEIPDSVTTIVNNPFLACYKLESINVSSGNPEFSSQNGILFNKDLSTLICRPAGKDGESYTIPNSVTTIGKAAFQDCTAKYIELPNSIRSIGEVAFAYCLELTNIKIPASVKSIEKELFATCPNLQNITVHPKNLNYVSVDGILFNKDLGALITYPAKKLETSYTIPSSVNRIESQAFRNCELLEYLEIADSVTFIGHAAFKNCSSLTTVNIPKSVSRLSSPFVDCKKLHTITVSEENENFTSLDGVLFNNDLTNLISYPIGKTDRSYIIPDSVTSVNGNNTFRGCISLTRIEIPRSVNSIGFGVFEDCESLSEIVFKGDKPSFRADIFSNISTNAVGYFYPEKNGWSGLTKIGDLTLKPITEKPPVESVATPILSPANGTNFETSLQLTLSCETEGAEIHYTTNGTNPTESSDLYSSPILLTETTTIKVKAFKAGLMASSIVTATFTKSNKPSEESYAVRTIDDTSITIKFTPPAGSGFSGVEETIPEGLTISNFEESNGSWDATNRKIKWLISNDKPAYLTYSVDGDVGEYTLSGEYVIDNNPKAKVSGDNLLTITEQYHPADEDQNWTLKMDEAIGYSSDWKNGVHRNMAYATRARYIWLSGENYYDSKNGAINPDNDAARWISGMNPKMRRVAMMASPIENFMANPVTNFEAGSIVRKIDGNSVQLIIKPSEGTLAYSISEEILPFSEPTEISDDGNFNSNFSEIAWFFNDGKERTLTYSLTKIDDSYAFIGKMNEDGIRNIKTKGDGSIIIPTQDWFDKFGLVGKSGTEESPLGKKGIDGKPLKLWQEFVLGTNPTDENSYFKVELEKVGENLVLKYDPNLGDTRKYTTEYKTNVLDQMWIPLENNDDINKILGEPINKSKFLRIRVEMAE